MGLIPEDVIAQVLDRTDIVEIVSSYIPLKKAGRNFKALSPFKHEKTASFVVSPDKQIFHCFSTGVGGNAVSFIMQMEHVTFPEAVRILAEKAGVVIPETSSSVGTFKNEKKAVFEVNQKAVEYFNRVLLSDKSQATVNARNYLKDRGLSLDTVKLFKIGFALDQWDDLIEHLRDQDVSLKAMETAGLIVARKDQKGFYDRFRGRIIFPIFDSFGNSIAFGARTLAEDQAKYINSPETLVYTKGKHLYGMDLAKHEIGKNDSAIIVEGYLDCITPHQAGVKNIVASCGTALTIEQIRSVKRFTRNIIMLFDTDSAGVGAMLRSIDLLIDEEMDVQIAQLEEGADPDSYIRAKGKEAFLGQLDQAKTIFEYKFAHLVQQWDSGAVESRAKIIAGMLPTIKRFKNEIVQSGYIEELSRKLRVSKDAVIKEFNKLSQSDRPRQYIGEKREERTPQQNTIPVEERNILSLMLVDHKFIEKAKQELSPEYLQSDKIKTIVSELYKHYDQNQDLNSVNLFKEDKPALSDFLSELIFEAEEFSGDKEKIFEDCMHRINRHRKLVLSEKLNSEIKEAEANKDLEKVYALLKQKNQLLRK